ncbi:anti-sigma regulatory factor [Clostridium tagluense]|uniref:anti-sigma regulatory factor n=1 Tax=Clostridium tagluense TaxID=360422 RepID=UPI001C6E7152|nr:anti-sigma regulatory factor [Clostridium tagluense]MBW9157948.1 anti-sigma regulatory factor [Clostridium tagluense]WLC66196.1 anti-sigma regulatory factor [Clostridium tagluense]
MGTMDGDFTLYAGKTVSVVEESLVKLVENFENGYAIFITRQIAIKAGFQCTDETMIATAASELATNIIRYAKTGEITISIIRNIKDGRQGVELFAYDKGPGIADINLAMQDQYSSLPHSLGLGLPSVKRIMDEFYIESILGKGTRVLARKWKK